MKQLAVFPTPRYSVYRAPPPGHGVFLSPDFPDEAVRKQVASPEYQVMLREHAWPGLEARGPCLASLAQGALLGVASRGDAVRAVRGEVPGLSDRDAEAVLDGMRLAAESYLARGDRQRPSWATEDQNKMLRQQLPVPDVVLGEGKFRPVHFLARGSASMVYAATATASTSTPREQANDPPSAPWVLKRCYPTQKESARNEVTIARKLRSKHVLDVTLLLDEGGNSWLLLPRVMPTVEFGVDLREFLDQGFFQIPQHQGFGQAMVRQLLEGLDFISSRGVVMRDVKPDNVLVRRTMAAAAAGVGLGEGGGGGGYEALWTDFGLAVDVTEIRSPWEVKQRQGWFHENDVLNWWYDVVKLVPRPKWKFRKPPERAFQDPGRVGVFSYDMYMTAIIFTSMSCGEDIPHLDAPGPKAALERALGVADLGPDYLNTFELGAAARACASTLVKSFHNSFGETFGSSLFSCVLEMLSVDPARRPSPREVLSRLQ